MRSFWSEPYLWVHLAGLATVPLLAEVCLVGLAVGDPWLPVWLELLLVGAAGIAPVLWMQWQRPFCIFSLTPLALRPDALSDDRRRMLHLFRGTEVQALAGSAAIALWILLWQLFRFAPVATEAAASLPQNRALGLLIAAVAFLLCNLFVQVPLSVIRVLLSSDAAIAQFVPYTPAEVAKSFTIPGFRVKQIVPELVAAAPRVKPAVKRDLRSSPYGNRPPAPPAAPLAADEALNESPWDESERSASEPVAPEPSPEPTLEPPTSESPAPEPLVPEPTLEPPTSESPAPEPIAPEPIASESPVEDSIPLPVPLAEESSPDFQPDEFQLDHSQSENAQPELISELQASSEALSDPIATLFSEASADLSADLSAASEDVAEALEGAIAQTSDAIAEAAEARAAEAQSLDIGDDLGDGVAAGLDALTEIADASAAQAPSSPLDPQNPEIVDASAIMANRSAAIAEPDEAIAAEPDYPAETLDTSLVADLQTPPEPSAVDVEALVAEALEAVDAELLRELPSPLTDVSLTDDADAAPEPLERPPAEDL
jgi:hypothetical protein